MNEPGPPNVYTRDAVARGLIPRVWVDHYYEVMGHRCTCSHRKGAHDEEGAGACETKICRQMMRCDRYHEDPRFELPPWNSKPIVEVGPIHLDAEAAKA